MCRYVVLLLCMFLSAACGQIEMNFASPKASGVSNLTKGGVATQIVFTFNEVGNLLNYAVTSGDPSVSDQWWAAPLFTIGKLKSETGKEQKITLTIHGYVGTNQNMLRASSSGLGVAGLNSARIDFNDGTLETREMLWITVDMSDYDPNHEFFLESVCLTNLNHNVTACQFGFRNFEGEEYALTKPDVFKESVSIKRLSNNRCSLDGGNVKNMGFFQAANHMVNGKKKARGYTLRSIVFNVLPIKK